MQPILPKKDTLTQIRVEEYRFSQYAKAFRKLISAVAIVFALVIGTSQLLPLSVSYAKGVLLTEQEEGNTFIPIPLSFRDTLLQVKYVDPGSDYFERIISPIANFHFPEIDTKYGKPMRISVPSVKIKNVSLTPNVPGSDKENYERILTNGVAHLKGTPLPGVVGTSIIYGHSGITGLLTNPNNPQIIFSRLDGVKLGEPVSIIKDGKTLEYVITSKKIVSPDDVTFVANLGKQEKIVLLTCWPLGIGTKRLVVIAERKTYE